MAIMDITPVKQAGIPLTNKMIKYGNSIDQFGNPVIGDLKRLNLDYDSCFRITSEQNKVETIERYMWIDVPFGLTPDLIERVLFYRGKGVLFFNDDVGKFQFLPFVGHTQIDEYGRWTRVDALPFTGVAEEKGGKGEKKVAVKRDIEIMYDLPYNKEMLEKVRNKEPIGIILNDSSLGISQQPVIRFNYVKPILHLMATLMQIINSAMFGCADHNLLQAEGEGQLASINEQIEAINQDILKGKRFTAIDGKFMIQPIKTSNTVDLEGLFNAFNSLSNMLKSITGIANSGIFDKKAHLLQEEQALNGSNSDDVYYNGLRQRQEAMLLFQAYYGYPTWVESKRPMSEAQAENYSMGETDDPDNTTQNTVAGGTQNDNQ